MTRVVYFACVCVCACACACSTGNHMEVLSHSHDRAWTMAGSEDQWRYSANKLLPSPISRVRVFDVFPFYAPVLPRTPRWNVLNETLFIYLFIFWMSSLTNENFSGTWWSRNEDLTRKPLWKTSRFVFIIFFKTNGPVSQLCYEIPREVLFCFVHFCFVFLLTSSSCHVKYCQLSRRTRANRWPLLLFIYEISHRSEDVVDRKSVV